MDNIKLILDCTSSTELYVEAMTDVLAGMVDFGMVSREVYPPEIEKGAVGFPSAKDAVVPTINAKKMSKLT